MRNQPADDGHRLIYRNTFDKIKKDFKITRDQWRWYLKSTDIFYYADGNYYCKIDKKSHAEIKKNLYVKYFLDFAPLGLLEALYLSQLLFLARLQNTNTISPTIEYIHKFTGLTREQQLRIKKKLQAEGLINYTRAKKTSITLNVEAIMNLANNNQIKEGEKNMLEKKNPRHATQAESDKTPTPSQDTFVKKLGEHSVFRRPNGTTYVKMNTATGKTGNSKALGRLKTEYPGFPPATLQGIVGRLVSIHNQNPHVNFDELLNSFVEYANGLDFFRPGTSEVVWFWPGFKDHLIERGILDGSD